MGLAQRASVMTVDYGYSEMGRLGGAHKITAGLSF
jgi:hypothetical protein